jgi:anaerobic selenocysteine-containing dehydrogenase
MKEATIDTDSGTVLKGGKAIGVHVDGKNVTGFPTPSRRQEFFSQTMIDWKWPEYTIPTYIKSHVHPEKINKEAGEFPLVPTFRLPVLIHSRSGNAKWLAEIANRNPIWIHTSDAKGLGIKSGDLIRVTTDIGHFVDKVWVTESIKPGIVACSHHIGRWRRPQDQGNRWATETVNIENLGNGHWKLTKKQGIRPFKSSDKDSSRIFWSDGGVHQNITHAVHPDPISGMHCWHQKVKLEKARVGDSYGDIFVDTNKSFAVYKEWLAMTRPAPGPDGLRRPLWFARALRPADETFYIKE